MSNLFPAKLIRVLLAFFLLARVLSVTAQAPPWQSAQVVAVATAAATSNLSIVTATAVDITGNVYLAGSFRNTVTLGSSTLTSLGSNDVFVAKFNPTTNQFVWAQRAGGPDADNASAIAVNSGSIYVAGDFIGATANFGTTTLTNVSGSSGYNDVFVTRLTDAGSFVWAQRAGGMGSDVADALAVSGANVYVAGSFISTTADFGSFTLVNTGTVAFDVFVTKLTDAGSFVWAQQAGGTGFDEPHALGVNGANVYITGEFNGPTAHFGTTTLTNAGLHNSFVAKLIDAGITSSFVWAQRVGGTGNDYGRALAVSGTSVYVAGHFDSPTVAFGATTLINGGIADVFVTKLTDMGNTGSFVWAQGAGGTSSEIAYALAVSGSNVYVTGYFRSPTASFGTTTLTRMGTYGIFLAKLNDTGSIGNFAWAQQAGGSSDNQAYGVVVNGTSVYIAGYFDSAIASFGPITLTNNNTGKLAYLASLTDPTLTATTPAVGTADCLYPNPAHRTATLRLPVRTTPTLLTLTDTQGRTVRHYPASTGSETTLDLHGLPAGLYLLRGTNFTQRLAVE